MTDEHRETLEALVDRCGLDHVLGGLAMICADKAEHISVKWQDLKLARLWTRAGHRCDATAISKDIERVSVRP